MWIELPEQVDTNDLLHKALENKISFSPGSIFTSQNKYNNCMRLNCGYPMDERIEKGGSQSLESCAVNIFSS